MSLANKIYLINNKQELINAIKSKGKTIILTFIKKYHKYYPFLSLFPTVLCNIIMEYVNDIFEVPCNIIYEWNLLWRIDVRTDIVLDYNTINLCFSVHDTSLIIRRHSMAYCPLYEICYSICHINYFLNKYYNRNHKFEHKHKHKHSKKMIHDFDKIIEKIDNLKHYKNEIIILTIIRNIVLAI